MRAGPQGALRLALLLAALLGLLLARHVEARAVAAAAARQDDDDDEGGFAARNNNTAAARDNSGDDEDEDATVDGVKKEMLANGVASTLNRLGEVLDKMHSQVVNDEKVFKNFKKRVLDEEIAKAEVDLSWPAIQDLVQSEVAVGRQKIRDQIAKFKLEVLDTVQKGLDALRSDLRATITAGFISANASALGDDRSTLLVPPKRKSETQESASSNAPNPDEEAAKSGTTESTVESVESVLEGKLPPDQIAKLAALLKEKLGSANQPAPVKLDAYGEDALQALKEMEAALNGKLSDRDLKSEIWEHLQKLTQAHLQHPSPATKKALEDMRTIIVHALASKLDEGHTDAPTEVYEPEDMSPEAENKRKELRNRQRAKMAKGSYAPAPGTEYDPMEERPTSVLGPRPDYVRTVGSGFNATEGQALEKATAVARLGDRPGAGPSELRFRAQSKLDLINQRLRELAARAAIRTAHASHRRGRYLSDDS